MIEAYPLQWPLDQARTPAPDRRRGTFAMGFGRARSELLRELELMGADGVVISSNLPLRRDGLPFADAREPADPGMAVYFTQNKRPRVIACDSYASTAANLRAIGATVEALRAIQRHGATELLERAFLGFAALPPIGGTGRPWWEVLGVAATATDAEIKSAYRARARRQHPDAGGDAGEMAELNRAYDLALRRTST